MTLATLCDIIWAEIWDDCPPLGNHAQYREIMHRYFIVGEDPSKITWKDADGKTHRLSDGPKRAPGTGPTKKEWDDLANLREQMRQAREAAAAQARELASPGDG